MNYKPNTRNIDRLSWQRRALASGAAGQIARNGGLLAAGLLAGALMLGAPMAQAALLAYEGFNYPTGGGNVPGLNGGFGWSGAWQTAVAPNSSIVGGSLVAGGNAPAGYDSHSLGNAIFTPNGSRSGRHLDTSAGGVFGQKGFVNGSGNLGAAGKTLYISFIQQPNIANNNYYEFEFHRGDLSDPGRVAGIGCDTAGSSSVYLRTPTAGQTLIGPASTAASFYVVRIDFLGGNDTVRVYQNPTSLTEPATPTLTETGAGDMSFNGISFGAFVNGATVAHDEVRLGETWADVVSPAVASTGLWTGAGADNNWSTPANWDNGVEPVFPINLTFAGTTRLVNSNDLTGVAANAITFNAAAGAFTLTGNSLGLNGNINFSGNPSAPVTQTIALPLVPSGDITIDTPTNGNLVLSGGVTSGGWLSTVDGGTLTLGGTNTFAALGDNGGTNLITGNTTINGQGGGDKFYLADGDSINGCKDTFILQPGAILSVTGNFGDAGVIGRDTGSATFIQNGGTFKFNPANQIYLFVGATSYPGTQSAYDMNGGLFDMSGFTLGVALSDRGVLSTSIVYQASGVITNVGAIWLGSIFTTGTGIFTMTGGTLYLGAGGFTNTGNYQINLSGGTIAAQASWNSALNMNLTNVNGSVTFNPAGNNILLSGELSGNGGFTVAGPGTLELSGANSYTGDTIINAGSTLQLDSPGSAAGAMRLVNGSTLNLNFNGIFAVGGFFTNGVAVQTGSYTAADLSGFVTGFGTLQVTHGISTGIWKGAGADNNWSTVANWDNNAVPIFPHALLFTNNTRVVNNNDLGGITISSLTFGSLAGFTLGGNGVTLTGGIGFNSTPTVPTTDTINFDMTFTGNQTFTLPMNGNLVLNGNLTSGSAFVQAGAGTLTLGGPNDTFSSYRETGGTNIITGNVTVAGTGGSVFYVGDIGTMGNLVIQPGASLNLTGSFGDAGVIGRDSGSGIIVQNGGEFSFNPANIANFFVGASSSAATRAEYDMNGGTLDMNNYNLQVGLSANTSTLITGVVNQVGGTINNVGLLNLGALTFGPGHGIYNLTGGSIYVGLAGIQSDSGSYEVNLGGGTVGAYATWSSPLNMKLTGSNGPVTFDTGGNVVHLSGNLFGPGGFNVIGGGTLELSGANNFNGDMSVTAAILQLDATGSSAGALRMVDGSTLYLNFSGNYVVGHFYTNGVALPSGTYTSANLSSFIAGTGVLLVQGVSTGLWTGQGGNGNWSNPANWDSDAEPIFPIGLTFAGQSQLNNNNDLTGLTASGITFDSAAGAFTLGGNSLGLTGGIGFNGTPAAPVTQTINLPLTPTADVVVSTPVNGNLAVSGGVTAANNTLYKLGGGTLTLNGNNTLAGYDVDGGTNVLAGNLSINGNNTRAYIANGDYSGGAIGTMVIPNGATFSISGNMADAFVVGRDGGQGKLVQNGGSFIYNPGSQAYLFVAAGNSTATRGEYDMNGGLLDMNGKTLGLALGVNVLVTGVVNQVSGVITNVSQLFLDSLFSTGHSIYNLTGGSLYLESGGIVVQSGGSYELNFGGGTVAAENSWSSPLNITLTGINGPVTFNPAGNTITLSGVLSGPGGLAVAGAGMLELSGTNTYLGDTTVAGGSTVRLDSASSTPGNFRLASGALVNLNYIGTYTVGGLYANGSALPSGTYNSGNLPAYLSGTGALQVGGAIPTTPTNIVVTVTTGHINLSWPASYQGWILQQQTNSLSAGLGTNWVDVPGSGSLTSTSIAINPATPTVFYRLRYPTP